jgi:protein TonB
MRILILIITALIATNLSFGQTTNDNQEKIIETVAEFPGGIQKFYSLITSNFNLSNKQIKKLKGKQIFIQFVVDSEGKIEEKSVSSVTGMTTVNDNKIIEDAVEIIKNSPKWKPATRNGEPIEMRQVIPIQF